MAYNSQIKKLIEEFDYHLFNLAEAYLDLKEESENKIFQLEEEIKKHDCSA